MLGAEEASTFGEKFDMKNRNTIQLIACSAIILTCLSFTFQASAQGNIGIGTEHPHPSAKLEVLSINQGVLVPRLKEAQRLGIVDPAKGLLVYDISHQAFFVYDGSWKKIVNEDQLTLPDHIHDADSDTWIHTESSPDQDYISIQAGGEDMGYINNKTFNFKSPGLSLFIGEHSGMNDNGLYNQNLFIGNESGTNTISGIQNTLIGHNAGRENTVGSRNLFIGMDAGRDSDSSNFNVILGSIAGRSLLKGSQNVVVGDYAGRHLENGNNNVFVGASAGSANANRINNVMIGVAAGSENMDGGGNVFLGAHAGKNSNGNNNVFVGNRVGQFEEGSNKLYIDNSSTDEPLIYGEFDIDELTINGALKIKNEYRFPIEDGADGQLLSTNGAGVLSWVENNAGNMTMLNDQDLDTKIQVEEMPDEDIIRFDLEGDEAMVLERNTAGMAKLSLNPLNSTVIIGNGAGEANEALTNVLIGYNAGQNNTDGSSNTMMGNAAGNGNTTGDLNTFIGSSSGAGNLEGSSNTLIGTLSGLFNDGSENVMVGTAAGSAIFGGNRNVLLGVRAGQNGTGSSRNVKVGYEAGLFDHTDDKLYIDNSASEYPLIFGDFEDDHLRFNGTVGVNTTPNSQFHVNSTSSQPAMRVEINSDTKLLVNENGGLTVGALQPDRTPVNGLYVDGSVNLGHIEAVPDYKLSVDGKVICEEIRVEDSGDWPDYVFKSDYEMMSLAQVDAYIKKEGHLPNIPAAQIVEEEGFDAGDMVKRLLEKIEELTLHTIRQQKEIDKLLGRE